MQDEIWKDTEYDGYMISNKGRVAHKDKILSTIQRTHRYESIMVGKNKRIYVHRLVATAFLPKEQGKNEVNHINGNTKDNRVENLEWVSHKTNMLHATNILKKWEEQAKKQNKKVKCIETGQVFESMKAASEFFGNYKNKGGGIGAAIKNKNKAFGFHWEYLIQ